MRRAARLAVSEADGVHLSTGSRGDMNRILPGFALASGLAVALGCVAAAGADVPMGIWIRNPAAWLAGVAVAAAVTMRMRHMSPGLWLVAITSLLAVTLVAPGLEGVHRWLTLGPVQVNVAALLLPAAIVVLASSALAPLVAVAILAVLVAQPDASQATAFAIASIFALQGRGRWGGAASALGVGLAIAAWLRPDPLRPVPEVEGIMALAWAVSPALAFLGAAALIASAAAPAVLVWREDPQTRNPALALSVYMLLTMLAPAIGAFPVPLLGIGMSPIVGSWLGIGCLALSARLNKAGGATPSGFR